MESLSILLLSLLSTAPINLVTAQEGPDIVIAHPGQDVELLCTVTPSGSQTTAWIINHVAYTVQQLHNGILTGYSSNGNNLIIENIMMNDDRNNTKYSCGTVSSTASNPTVADIEGESDPTILYVTGGVTSPPSFTTIDNIARSSTITTNLIPMTTSSSSVVTTSFVSSEEASTVMISTPAIMSSTPAIMSSTIDAASTSHVDVDTTITSTTALNEFMTNTTTSDKNRGKSEHGNGSGVGNHVSVIAFIIIFVMVYCGMIFLFFYCYKRKEKLYQHKDFCDKPRSSLIVHTILGVFTFGISIVVWYMIVKCKANKDDDKHCRIVHVSIIVLAIYTFGISLLLWWLYKCTAKGFSCIVKDDSKVQKGKKDFEQSDDYEDVDNAHYTASPQALGEVKHIKRIHYDYASSGPVALAVSGAKNTRQFASTKSKQRSTAPQYPVPDGMQHPVSAKVDHRNTVPHKTTVGGVPYALSTKVSVQGNNTSRDNTKNRKLKYADLDLQAMTDYENVVSRDSDVQYATIS